MVKGRGKAGWWGYPRGRGRVPPTLFLKPGVLRSGAPLVRAH